jgi:acetyltransferase-like isoleucine patch superfamily enzyme
MKRHENKIAAPFNRVLQVLARISPGATSLRVWLHRWRGVRIGDRVWIGYDAIIETAYPNLVEIQDDVEIGIRATIIAHFKEAEGVVIEKGAFIGPGVIIMPNVRIGKGAVVMAGSIVTTSVAPMTLVQGNPAKPVAKAGVMLESNNPNISLKQFIKHLKPLR